MTHAKIVGRKKPDILDAYLSKKVSATWIRRDDVSEPRLERIFLPSQNGPNMEIICEFMIPRGINSIELELLDGPVLIGKEETKITGDSEGVGSTRYVTVTFKNVPSNSANSPNLQLRQASGVSVHFPKSVGDNLVHGGFKIVCDSSDVPLLKKSLAEVTSAPEFQTACRQNGYRAEVLNSIPIIQEYPNSGMIVDLKSQKRFSGILIDPKALDGPDHELRMVVWFNLLVELAFYGQQESLSSKSSSSQEPCILLSDANISRLQGVVLGKVSLGAIASLAVFGFFVAAGILKIPKM